MKKTFNCQNEEGFVLVFALLIMAVLTVLGLMATNNTIIEMQIAGNEKLSKLTFYKAESAAYEAGQRLDDTETEDDLKVASTLLPWLLGESSESDFTMKNYSNFVETAHNRYKSSLQESADTVSHVAFDEGVVNDEGEESSEKMTATTVRQYKLMGFVNSGGSKSSKKLIEVGYRKEL